MSRKPQLKEELELDQLLATEQELRQRELEFTENQRRMEQERLEQERTIPPLDEIQLRAKRREHEQIISRGEIANIRRDQNRSLVMLVLLMLTTCALVWWGLQMMRQG